MRKIFYVVVVLVALSCASQGEQSGSYKVTISPAIDETNVENKKIILVVEKFLKSKNSSLTENEYWLQSDFDRYIHPFGDIHRIEHGSRSENYYKPTLMELVAIDDKNKLVKLGFVGFNPETNESIIRAIYNVIAFRSDTDWKLKRAIDYYTLDWQTRKDKSITYKLPKGRKADESEMARQSEDIDHLCEFFNTSPLDIIYYSCFNPKQVFEVKGFDYYPNMYFGNTGGMADLGGIIYSGNNSEYYTHEIVHLYTNKLFPNNKSLLHEGIATYIGGSGVNDYTWHREKMGEYLRDSAVDLGEHLDPYERLYIDNETSIPYMIGALICERTYRIYGKGKLFELLDGKTDLLQLLGEVGLTVENLTTELTKEVVLLPTLYMK